MIKKLRKKFNDSFDQNNYDNFLHSLNTCLKYPTDFQVCETPLFLSKDLTNELIEACDDIISQITTTEYKEFSKGAVPEQFKIPNETDHPEFLQIDFAITSGKNNNFIPKLIELQGFPSLYCYEVFLDRKILEFFDIPKNFTTYFNDLNESDYINLLKDIIVGENNPRNVVLMEIDPEIQKTRIDFAATEKLLEIKTISIRNILQKDNELFYKENDNLIKIERIYNRVIFDELFRKNIKLNFDFQSNLKVKWLPHPNWFFKISKYSLPFLKGKYVSNCFFLNELNEYPDDLSKYVLKPLYSFAGLGVEMDLSKEKLDKIRDKENYILQEKIEYAPLIETPEGYSKVEIRMMFLWKDKPMLVHNLVRTSKGKMMGVDFNKNKSWVGSSIAYHE